jgi:hypothetical protein
MLGTEVNAGSIKKTGSCYRLVAQMGQAASIIMHSKRGSDRRKYMGPCEHKTSCGEQET